MISLNAFYVAILKEDWNSGRIKGKMLDYIVKYRLTGADTTYVYDTYEFIAKYLQ